MKKIKSVLGISVLSILTACGTENNDSSNINVGTEIETNTELGSDASFSLQADSGVQAYAINCGACHGG